MRLKFKATERKPTHLANDVRFFDGNVKDLPPRRAEKLLKAYPDNFQIFGYPPPLTKLNSTPLVSILIPQRGRSAYIKKCLELILKNTTYPNYEIILICDRDDMNSVATIPQHKKIKVVTDPSPVRQMFVGKINYGFRISTGEYLVYLANDIEVSKNWLSEAMKTMLGVFSDKAGLVGFNHGDPQKHAYHGLISRRFVNQYLEGNIFYPGYIHFWCDLDLVRIARKLNRFSFCPTSRVYHKSIKDDVQAEGWIRSYNQGANLLIKRTREGFPL